MKTLYTRNIANAKANHLDLCQQSSECFIILKLFSFLTNDFIDIQKLGFSRVSRKMLSITCLAGTGIRRRPCSKMFKKISGPLVRGLLVNKSVLYLFSNIEFCLSKFIGLYSMISNVSLQATGVSWRVWHEIMI